MASWYFVRHAQSEANAHGWLAGQVDAPLTEFGIEQAILARPQLACLEVQRAFSSDLLRARHTADLLLSGFDIPIVTTPKLRERDCGDWAHRPLDEVRQRGDHTVLEEWHGRPPRGESLRDVAERALEWLHTVDDGQNTLVVTHGGLIRAVVGLIDRTPSAEIGLWKPQNCEFSTRVLELGGWATLALRLDT